MILGFELIADLPPLSLRSKELAAVEYSRIIRPPPEDPARSLLRKTPPPRLRCRAHEAWRSRRHQLNRRAYQCPRQSTKTQSCRKKVPPPSRWMGMRQCETEQPADGTPALAFYQGTPPWNHCGGGAVRFVLELQQATRRTDPPERRKEL